MNARKYAVCGVLFGIFFPVCGTLLQAMFFGHATGDFSARVIAAQSMPIMWIVDTAPLVFGVMAWLGGVREDHFRAIETSKSAELAATASELYAGAQNLLNSVSTFSSMTNQTAASVRETTTTMQQLSQTATQAALSAETVVGLAKATKKCSEDGLQDIKVSVTELMKLSEEVRGLAKNVEGLNERMRSVFEIASVMNYLSDRFQSLADSAVAEIGQNPSAKGLPIGLRFIVAEMHRQGKDAKKGATLVQNMLNEMHKALAATVAAAENGVRRAERGAQIASKTGDNIKQLASALQNSSQAAMEIASIAKQQDHGVDEVLKAMNEVFRATEDAVSSTQRVAEEAKALNELAHRLDESVRKNGAMSMTQLGAAGPRPALKAANSDPV